MLKLRWLTLLALSCCATAADRSDWSRLGALVPGDTVRVDLATKQSVSGRFESWTPDRLTLTAEGGQPYEADKTTVARVRRIKKGGRMRRTAIGAAIGFGAGFVAGAAASADCKSFCIVNPALGGAIVGMAGAVGGAVVGVLVPGHNAEVIYAARR